MEKTMKEKFLHRWKKYLGDAELPLVLFYSDDEEYGKFTKPVRGHVCMVGRLNAAVRGETVAFTGDTIGCHGGVLYCGYPAEFRPNFRYFLSCGIPGELEGERYKKTPEFVDEYVRGLSIPPATGKYIVFKRWDLLEEDEDPEVVIFLSPPDVVSALFTLVHFGVKEKDAVLVPFSSGCGSIVTHPRNERINGTHRAVLGMLDISARPYLKENLLAFSIDIERFRVMVDDMDESFLVTESWRKVKRRV